MPALAGLGLAALSAVFNGSFVSFAKLVPAEAAVHPIVFNLYLSFGVFLSSCAVAPFLPLLGSPPLVCPLGAVAGLIFVGASSLSFVAVENVGVSSGQGVFGGMAILVSFLWGTLGPAPIGLPVVSLPLTLLAVAILLIGVGGIVKCEPLGAAIASHFSSGSSSSSVSTAPRPDRSTPLAAQAASGPDAEELGAECDADCVAPESGTGIDFSIEGGGGGSVVDNQGTQGSRIVGFAAAISVGVFGGSILVPLGFLGDDYKGSKALAFLPSFGAGCLAGASALAGAWYLTFRPVLGTRRTLLCGLASGITWNLGNVCQLLAMSVFLVPYGVAYPLLQASLVVAGILGIAVFKELRDPHAISAFFLASALVVIGAVLLGLYGPSPPPSPQLPTPHQPPALPSGPVAAPPTSPPSPAPVWPPHAPYTRDVRTLVRMGKELTKIISIQMLGCVPANVHL